VLGAEDGGQVHPVFGVHDVDDVACVSGDACGVGDDAGALAAELGVGVCGEGLETCAEVPAALGGGGLLGGCLGLRGRGE
jgi:hypothetical protein